MSIFDPGSGFNPLPWLQEKTLSALEEAARLVDLANEPDTTSWYAKTLRDRAARLVGRLAPAVALLHEAGGDAAASDSWAPVLDGGTFALAAWCKKWKIADPTRAALAATAPEREDDEAEEKAERIEQPAGEAEDREGRRLTIYASYARRMVHEKLSEPERRLLLWLLAELWLARLPDVALASRKFLPGDIDCTVAETAAAYRSLFERGFIERVDNVPGLSDDALALRLIVAGVNESKHPPAFKAETFGFPGARLGGKRTIGNIVIASLPDTLGAALERWFPTVTAEDTSSLAAHLQERLGVERVFIEAVELRPKPPSLVIRVRHTWEQSDRDIRADLEAAAATWLRDRVVG